jgi:hypothetical protein
LAEALDAEFGEAVEGADFIETVAAAEDLDGGG